MPWQANPFGGMDWIEPPSPVFDIMIDIETLGVKPGSVILNIGAVEFEPNTGVFGNDFYMAIDVSDSQSYDMTIDAATIVWWMQQSAEARLNSFGDGTAHSLFTVLQALRAFVG